MMPAQQGVLVWPRDEANLSAWYMRICSRSRTRRWIASCSCMRSSTASAAAICCPSAGGSWPAAGGFWRWCPTAAVYGRGSITRRLVTANPSPNRKLLKLLRDHDFAPVENGHALFVPPYATTAAQRFAPALEKVGGRWFTTFAGVVMIEAQKQISPNRLASAAAFSNRRSCPPTAGTEQPNIAPTKLLGGSTMYIVAVRLVVDPSDAEAFAERLKLHARNSLTQSGCRVFGQPKSGRTGRLQSLGSL